MLISPRSGDAAKDGAQIVHRELVEPHIAGVTASLLPQVCHQRIDKEFTFSQLDPTVGHRHGFLAYIDPENMCLLKQVQVLLGTLHHGAIAAATMSHPIGYDPTQANERNIR